MICSIANYGRSRRPWYSDALIPEGALFGTVTQRYEYTTLEDGRTRKRLISCDKIPFYCTDFRPTYKKNKYKDYNIPVYNIVVWDVHKKRLIHTNTSASADYFYIGEVLDFEIFTRNLCGKHVFPVAYAQKDAPCKLRTVGRYTKAGRAYGYMCKTPDRTITEADAIGDDFAENRRFKH